MMRPFRHWAHTAGCCVLLLATAGAPAGHASSPSDGSPDSPSPRPRIILALGGGGAKGFAHIGVLKVLEELRIPVDGIAGTSMGAIIGGLYASGMSPEEIEAFMKRLDWWDILNDETPRKELDFRRKLEDQRYLLGFELGLQRFRPVVPSGVASGQKFNNIMQMLVLRAAGIRKFDRLPIPFRAVATDIETGEAVVLDRGNLATAMRASMAVPGVFTPVDLDGRLLVDGGIVNNIPADVARAMGADIVIAVDLGASDAEVSRDDLRSIMALVNRTYILMQRPRQLETLKNADIVIAPNLKGMTASQFHRVADIIPTGTEAARAMREQLEALSVDADTFDAFLQRQRRPGGEPLMVGSITVSGNQRVSEKAIRGRLISRAGEPLDTDNVSIDLMRIYGIGEFEQVLFRVSPEDDETYELRYDAKEKPWGPTYVRLGFRLESDLEKTTDWGLLLNVTRRSVNRLGAEWANDIQLGQTHGIASEFYQPLDEAGFFFVAPGLRYSSQLVDIYDKGEKIAEYDTGALLGRFDLGVQLRHYAEARAGVVWGTVRADVKTGAADLPTIDEQVGGVVAGLTVDRLDRSVFSREGYYASVIGFFTGQGLGSDRTYDKLLAVYDQYMSLGNHTFGLAFEAGSSLGTHLPEYDKFYIGGVDSLPGLGENELTGSYAGALSVSYGYRFAQLPPSLGRGLYGIIRVGAGNTWENADDADIEDLRYGAGIGLGADTEFGPLYIGYGHADEGDYKFYFSVGTVF